MTYHVTHPHEVARLNAIADQLERMGPIRAPRLITARCEPLSDAVQECIRRGADLVASEEDEA